MLLKPATVAPVLSNDQAAANRKAFLSMIAFSEGTYNIGKCSGYSALFGGGAFSSFADHPRQEFYIKRLNIFTSAAGRYQIEKGMFDAYKRLLDLPDFTPQSQDAIAIQMIKEKGALPDIDAGRIPLAIAKCASIWASFPSSKAGQPAKTMAELLGAFTGNGGKLA
jgi:muramidase (phage lysozyme)